MTALAVVLGGQPLSPAWGVADAPLLTSRTPVYDGDFRIWVAVVNGALVVQAQLDPDATGDFITKGGIPFLEEAGGAPLVPRCQVRRPMLWIADFGNELPTHLRVCVPREGRTIAVEITVSTKGAKGEAAAIRRLKEELKGSQRALAAAQVQVRELEAALSTAKAPPSHPLVAWLGTNDGYGRSVSVERATHNVRVALHKKETLVADVRAETLEGAISAALDQIAAHKAAKIAELRKQLAALEQE